MDISIAVRTSNHNNNNNKFINVLDNRNIKDNYGQSQIIIIIIIIIIIQLNSFIYVLDNSQKRPITAKH
jgi:hypothetical protein